MCAILWQRSAAAFGILVSMVTETRQAKENPERKSSPCSHLWSTDLLTTRGVNMLISAFIRLKADRLQLSLNILIFWGKQRETTTLSKSVCIFICEMKKNNYYFYESMTDLSSCWWLPCLLMITMLSLPLFYSFATISEYESSSLPVFPQTLQAEVSADEQLCTQMKAFFLSVKILCKVSVKQKKSTMSSSLCCRDTSITKKRRDLYTLCRILTRAEYQTSILTEMCP